MRTTILSFGLLVAAATAPLLASADTRPARRTPHKPAVPTFTRAPTLLVARAGSALETPIIASVDEAGTTVSIQSTVLPSGATLVRPAKPSNPTSYVLKYVPPTSDQGKTSSVCFQAESSEGQKSIGQHCISIKVEGPPRFTQPPAVLNAEAGVPFEAPVVAVDYDTKATIMVSSTPLPANASLVPSAAAANPANYTLKWTPAPTDKGKAVTICFHARTSSGFSTPGQYCTQINVAP